MGLERQDAGQTRPYPTREGALSLGGSTAAVWAGPLLVAALVILLRVVQIERSFEVFIDEVTYLRLARSVADNFRVFLGERPFFLHPPAGFFIQALYLKLAGVQGTVIEQVYAMRLPVVLFAAVSAALLFDIVRRAAGWPAAILAALLFALEPFIVKVNSLNMLETPALTWVLAGYWAIISVLPRRPLTSLSTGRLIAAGLFWGLALLTKEMTLFLTLLPLAAWFVVNEVLERREAIVVGGTAVLAYLVYPTVVLLSGQWPIFAAQKFRGLERFAGLVKETGFGRGVGPSLLDSLLKRLGDFGSTYVLIALGALSLYVLLRRRSLIPFVVLTWTASAYALLGFSVVIGTLEEHFFYFLIVPSVAAVAIAAAMLWQDARLASLSVDRRIVGAVLAILLTWNSYQWILAHRTPDNGYERVLGYLEANALPEADVASTSETGQFVLEQYRSGPWGTWQSPAELQAFAPDYVLVSPHTLDWNFGPGAGGLLGWIEQNGRPVFAFDGREHKRLVLYQLGVR